MLRRHTLFSGLLATLCCLGALAACSAETPAKRRPVVAVTTVVAETGAMPIEFTTLGVVEPADTVAIRSRVPGIIARVLFREGQDVRAGDPLFLLDDRAARAELAVALAAQTREDADLNRVQHLEASGFISPSALETARADAETARAQVRMARTQLDYLTIRAPIAGRAGESTLKPGASVGADQIPLVTINRIEPVRIRFGVPQQQINAFAAAVAAGPVGATARSRDGGPVQQGQVDFIDNAVSAQNGQLIAKAVFPNANHALWPGAVVEVAIRLGERAGLVAVPEAAVVLGEATATLFVIDADDAAARREVEIAGRHDGLVYLARGVAHGERVVVEGGASLRPGDRVRVGGGGGAGGSSPAGLSR